MLAGIPEQFCCVQVQRYARPRNFLRVARVAPRVYDFLPGVADIQVLLAADDERALVLLDRGQAPLRSRVQRAVYNRERGLHNASQRRYRPVFWHCQGQAER